MLTISEEILLLFLDDEEGTFVYGPSINIGYVISGSILMDLALTDKIDTDPDRLFVVDKTPMGDDIFDDILSRIAESEEDKSTAFWVQEITRNATELEGKLIGRLVEKGILKKVEGKFLWVFETRRYPMINGTEQREIIRRLKNVLFSDEIPDPRDIVIVSLMHACELINVILDNREVESVRPRLEQIAKMDLIGQEVRNTIQEIRVSISTMVTPL